MYKNVVSICTENHYLSVFEVLNTVMPITTDVIRQAITTVRTIITIESDISKLLWTGFLVQIIKDCQTVYRRV